MVVQVVVAEELSMHHYTIRGSSIEYWWTVTDNALSTCFCGTPHLLLQFFPKPLSLALRDEVAEVEEIQILNWYAITYADLRSILTTFHPVNLHYQRQPAAHFADAANGYVDELLKDNGRLRLLTYHCATNLSWKQIRRVLFDHPNLRLHLGWAVIDRRQVFDDTQAPMSVKQVAIDLQCTIDCSPDANLSIGLAGRTGKTIRIFQGKEKVTITSDRGLQSFLAFRDAQFRAPAHSLFMQHVSLPLLRALRFFCALGGFCISRMTG